MNRAGELAKGFTGRAGQIITDSHRGRSGAPSNAAAIPRDPPGQVSETIRRAG
ncbi:hypothetical protein F8B43_3046 [Methylorubrum populi]|uniref:Uncharacterized protein n=1 Tax=Methylorubrum populi TaxID=223967 RepID=A0A833J5H3_9HYPH|nr:hypothetical protein F8B43_3046 [Methylorubrum populi]